MGETKDDITGIVADNGDAIRRKQVSNQPYGGHINLRQQLAD